MLPSVRVSLVTRVPATCETASFSALSRARSIAARSSPLTTAASFVTSTTCTAGGASAAHADENNAAKRCAVMGSTSLSPSAPSGTAVSLVSVDDDDDLALGEEAEVGVAVGQLGGVGVRDDDVGTLGAERLDGHRVGAHACALRRGGHVF